MKYCCLLLLFLLLSGCAETVLQSSENPIPGNDPPGQPSSPAPGDGSLNQDRFITLRWECTDPDAGDTLKYDVYFGNTNPPATLVAQGTRIKSHDIGLAAANTLFYWRVTAKDNNGAYTESPVWRFTTGN